MTFNYFQRAADLLLKPKEAWEAVRAGGERKELAILYPMVLALIPASAMLAGYWIVGIPGQFVRISFASAFFSAVVFYILTLAAAGLTAAMVGIFCSYFNVEGDWTTYIKIAAYSSTAPILANVFYLLPVVKYLKIVGFYGCVTLFVGLPVMLRIPKEKEMQFTITVIVSAVIIAVIFSGLVDQFVGPLYMDAY